MQINNKITIHTSSSSSVCLSPNSQLLAAVGGEPGFQLYNIEDKKLLKSEKAAYSKVTFSSNGNFIALANKNVKIIDGHTFKKVTVLKTKVSRGLHVQGMVFFDNEQKIITTSEKKSGLQQICIWEIPSGELLQTFEITQYPVFGEVYIAPNEKSFLVSDNSQGVLIYDLTKDQDQTPKKAKRMVHHYQYTPDGKYIICAEKGVVEFSKAKSMRKSHKILDQTDLVEISDSKVWQCCIAPNNKHILVKIGGGKKIEEVKSQVWLANVDGELLYPLTSIELVNGSSAIQFHSISFSSDSTKAIIGKTGGEVDIIELSV